jgi:hypothetical protein
MFPKYISNIGIRYVKQDNQKMKYIVDNIAVYNS